MFDLFCGIWSEPGCAYAPFITMNVRDEDDPVMLSKRLNRLYKAGFGGVVIRHAGSCSDPYFSRLGLILEKAKNRGMSVIIEADDSVVSERSGKLGRLCPMDSAAAHLPAFRVFRKTEKGRTASVSLTAGEGLEPYEIGYTEDPSMPDRLCDAYSEAVISMILEPVSERFGKYLGSTLAGFMLRRAGAECVFPDETGTVPWNENIYGGFLSSGGDMEALMSLLEEPLVKKTGREAGHIMKQILCSCFCRYALDPLRKWCDGKNLLLFADSFDPLDPTVADHVSAPGACLSDFHGAKLAADCARHRGLPKCWGVIDGSEDLSAVQDRIYTAVRSGCNMTVIVNGADPCTDPLGEEREEDLRIVTSFIKRMSWLASSGSDLPEAAVLCSPEYLPKRQAGKLAEAGYSFNYLTVRDLMERAHVHGDGIHIDRYEYGTVLVDSAMRIDAEILRKLGELMAGGGVCIRSGGFAQAALQVPRGDHFRTDGGPDPFISRYRKSGCDFTVFCNPHDEPVSGEYITENSCGSKWFDPVNGDISPAFCSAVDKGFSYRVTVPSGGCAVLGADPGALPLLREEAPDPRETGLISSEAAGTDKDTFSADRGFAKAEFSADGIGGFTEVRVNGKKAGTLALRPYTLDISRLTSEGVNTVKTGRPVKGGVVRLYR